MKRKILAVAAIITSSHLSAQDSTQQLDPVVVTANKMPQKQSTTGKVLTVISRQQLENNTGRSLAQVLNEQAGLIINGAQNAPGSNLTVYLRGASAANTLILVDGVPANDASGISNEFDLNQFSIDQIERVEILKGAQSVLYGSDAVAGVINIITKKANMAKPANVYASAAGGTYNTYKGTAGVSGKAGIISYNAQYTRLQSKGFSAAQDTTNALGFDKDGIKQDVFGAKLGVQATKNWNISLFSQYGQYKYDLDDAAFTDDKNSTGKNKNLQAGLTSKYDFTKGSVTVNLNMNNIKRTLDDEKNVPADPADFDPFNGSYKGKTLFGEAYTNLNLHKHIGLLAGVDVRDQKADIETTYGKLGSDSLHTTQGSGYASIAIKQLGGFNAEVGGRYTHHSKFGSAFTYSINPSYLINKQFKIFANLSSGFRSPSIYNIASEYGNKDLKPEKSVSIEGGVQYVNTANTVNVRATYFDRHIKDVIIFQSTFIPPYGQYMNADKQKDHGFEVEAILQPAKGWSITANYAYVDGKVENVSASTGKDTSVFNLFKRPKHAVNASVGYTPIKKLYTAVGFRWVGDRTDLFFNNNTFATEQKLLKSYYNLDFYASYQIVKQVKVFADLRNITDKQYFDQYGYNSRRFNCMFGAVVNL